MTTKPLLKVVLPVLLLACSLSAGVANAQTTATHRVHRILFQVLDDNPVRWTEVLGIANNVQQLLGKNEVRIEIVVHGGGIHMVTLDSALANRIQHEQKNGVVFAACSQTMKRHNYTSADLLDGIKVVPIGAVEIMQKQEAGWTYIRL